MTNATSTLTTGTATSCSSSPTLLAGLSVSVVGGNCVISGTPATYTSSASYTITATNSVGSTSTTIAVSADVDRLIGGFSSYLSCSIKPTTQEASCRGGNNTTFPNVLIGASSTTKVLDQVAGLFVGSSFSYGKCAYLTNGEARCWGYIGRYFGGGENANGYYESLAAPVLKPDGTGRLGSIVSGANGGTFSCFATSDGSAYCSGQNTNGILGNGTTTASAFPVQVLNPSGTGPLTGVVEVAAGNDFACARTSAGEIYCWGNNNNYQLDAMTPASSALPVAVESGNTGFTAMSAGYQHMCAINGASGYVYCWGLNSSGQAGAVGAKVLFTQVKGVGGVGVLSGVSQLTTGFQHSCGIVSGAVQCWGASTMGQLGNNTVSATAKPNPQDMLRPDGAAAISGVTLVTSGYQHVCALSSVEGLVCAGLNATGQLGDGTSTNRSLPVVVKDLTGSAPLTGASSITASRSNSCAVVSGSVYCWGYDFYGQNGQGTAQSAANYLVTPGPVKTWDTVTTVTGPVSDVVLGENLTCTQSASGELTCWGGDGNGMQGDGTGNARAVPAEILDSTGLLALSGVVRARATTYHICAVLTDQTVLCWGRNQFGQLGDGTTTNRTRPVHVKDAAGTGVLSGIVDVSLGTYHSCALTVLGAVYCWGTNTEGEVGDGTIVNRSLPTMVKDPSGTATLSNIARIDSGNSTNCAVDTSGNVQCWGYNLNAQIGDGTTTNRTLPVSVLSGGTALTGVSSIALGNFHGCAVKSDQTVACWGYNPDGELGDGTTTQRASATSVIDVTGSGVLGNILRLAATRFGTCAVNSSNQKICWGSNSNGNMGLSSGPDLSAHAPTLTNF